MEIITSGGLLKNTLATAPAPHLRSPLSTTAIMALTLAALLPAAGVTFFYFGAGVLWQLLICSASACVCQLACGMLRRRSLYKSLGDLSYLVTAAILALTLPPLIPFYFSALAAAFAIVIVKECFGGLGMNIFNPAMAGFIFILISAPSQLYDTFIAPAPHAYLAASPRAAYSVIFSGADAGALREEVRALASGPDALSGATFLERSKTARKSGELKDLRPVSCGSGGPEEGYLWLAGAYALGGLILLCFHIIFLRMVIAFLVSLAGFAALGWYFLPDLVMPPDEQLLLGGTMIAAFFIITDPVTNAGTARGRIVFAALCAFLIILLRAFGSYSDSVAFAVMLANAAAPLIDVLTRRRVYGYGFATRGKPGNER